MTIEQQLKTVLDYCKFIDRNGSWDEVISNIETNETSLIDELEILHGTLTDWLFEEESGGINVQIHTKCYSSN